jgi:hypothetical protein
MNCAVCFNFSSNIFERSRFDSVESCTECMKTVEATPTFRFKKDNHEFDC